MGSALTSAIQSANLPALLERHFPHSLKRGYRVCPVWRSESRDLDAALKRFSDGTWILTDFALSKSWNAYQFLTDLCSYTPREAARLLILESGIQDTPKALTTPNTAILEPSVLAEFPECITDFLRLNALYFGGRLARSPGGTVSQEYRTLVLEPLADWISSCAADFGLGTLRNHGAT